MPPKKVAKKAVSKSSGVEVVQHKHIGQDVVRAWVSCKLQPQDYNMIEVGFSYETPIKERETPGKATKRAGAAVLLEFEKQVKAAFKKLGFTF